MSTSITSSTLLNDLEKSGAQEEEIDVSVIERLVNEEELNNKNSSSEQSSEKESLVEDTEAAKKDEAKMHRLSTFIVNPENLTQKPVGPEDQSSAWFYCGDCGARFSTEEILEEHVVKHTGK